MSEVVLLLAADTDIQGIYERLEELGGPGRGDVFAERLEAALDRLRLFPGSGPIHRGPARRLMVLRTNYGVFYTVAGLRVMVSRVLDLRQDPAMILRRLGE